MRILVVDDEPAVRNALDRALRFERYEVRLAGDGDDALRQLADQPADAIVLDVGLPGIDGLEVCRRLRGAGDRTPVLMLTARETVDDRVAGLDAGADDYLVKPFDFEELVARIEALHRRGTGQDLARRVGPLTLDVRRRALVRGEEETSLTAREMALLSALLGRAGDALTRSELLATVWGPAFDGEPNVVDVYVGYLRQKLRTLAGDEVSIQALRGVGFRLVTEKRSDRP